MSDLSERQICDRLWKWHKEGQASRRDGGVNPYRANTVAYFEHCAGWLQEDLRIALIAASPRYARSQGVEV